MNAESIDIVYAKCDGNKGDVIKSYPLSSLGMSTGQNVAYLRDVSVDIVRIANELKCPIACKNLDFSAKKSQLRHSGSKSYNRMLSGFVYDKFRAFLVFRVGKGLHHVTMDFDIKPCNSRQPTDQISHRISAQGHQQKLLCILQ